MVVDARTRLLAGEGNEDQIVNEGANNDLQRHGSVASVSTIVPETVSTTLQTWFGKIRPSLSRIEYGLMGLSLLNMAVGLAFALYRHFTLNEASDQYIFLTLFCSNLLFALVYIIHGIFQEQPFEILLYILTTIFMVFLGYINLVSSEVDQYANFRLIRFIFSIVLSVPNVILALIVTCQYWRSGYLASKTMQSYNPEEIKMYRLLFSGYSLLIFDTQSTFSCIILALDDGIDKMGSAESIGVFAGIFFMAVWITMGFVAMRTEDKPLTKCFFLTAWVLPITVGYLLGLAFRDMDMPHPERYKFSLILTTVVWVLAHLALIILVPFIYLNYGKGLRQEVYGRHPPPEPVVPESSTVTHAQPGISNTALFLEASYNNSPRPQRKRQGYNSIA